MNPPSPYFFKSATVWDIKDIIGKAYLKMATLSVSSYMDKPNDITSLLPYQAKLQVQLINPEQLD